MELWDCGFYIGLRRDCDGTVTELVSYKAETKSVVCMKVLVGFVFLAIVLAIAIDTLFVFGNEFFFPISLLHSRRLLVVVVFVVVVS